MKPFQVILGLTVTFAGGLTGAQEAQNIGINNNKIGFDNNNIGSPYSDQSLVAALDPSQLNSLLASSQSDSGYESNIDVTALAASSFNGYGQDTDANSGHVQMIECDLPHYFLCNNGNCLQQQPIPQQHHFQQQQATAAAVVAAVASLENSIAQSSSSTATAVATSTAPIPAAILDSGL